MNFTDVKLRDRTNLVMRHGGGLLKAAISRNARA
jgi:hypothetical protein